ncbi:MAG: hypothetical protein KBT34_03135 [Prevotella sp.]|nr:hypothetical protein [Candidatus Prevotella equi]
MTIEELEAENEQLRDELDALHMRYLSQVSLWESNYKKLKKKLEEPVDRDRIRANITKLKKDHNNPYRLAAISIGVNYFDRGYEAGYRKAWEDKQ